MNCRRFSEPVPLVLLAFSSLNICRMRLACEFAAELRRAAVAFEGSPMCALRALRERVSC